MKLPLGVFILSLQLTFNLVECMIESRQYPRKLAICFNKYYYNSYTVNHQVGLSMLIKCINDYKWTSPVPYARNRITPAAKAYASRLIREESNEINEHKRLRRRGKRQARRHKIIRVRKEYRMMSDNERRRYHRAVQGLKRPNRDGTNRYDFLSSFHDGSVSTTAHGGCNFPGWHRAYIRMYESALRSIDPGVTLPYWDSTLDQYMEDSTQSLIWSDEFMGNGDGEVVSGPFANWQTGTSGPLIRGIGLTGELMTHEEIRNITDCTRMSEICRGSDPLPYTGLEFHHGDPHVWLGGQMGSLETAAEEPMFFMHHCFIDLLWEEFRNNSRRSGINVENDYPTSDFGDDGHDPTDSLGLLSNLTVRDGLLDFWMEDVRYDPRPTCTRRNRDCGSDKLRCVRIDRRFRCISKTLQEYERDRAERRRNRNNRQRPNNPTTPRRTLFGGLFDLNSILRFSRPLRFFQEIDQCPANVLDHRPVQNTFCSNNERDINQWAYVPVRIMSLRAPNFKRYGSYPIKRGSLSRERDIYSTEGFENLNPGNPRSYQKCRSDKTGAGEIFVRSDGLNYDGSYQEYAIADQRLSVSVSIAYVAVRNPRTSASEALISAYDSCGRMCLPTCLNYRTKEYEPCSGVINVSTRSPKMYGERFAESVMDVYDFTPEKHCPQMKSEKIYLSFFCDYSEQWPWRSAVNQTGASPWQSGTGTSSSGWNSGQSNRPFVNNRPFIRNWNTRKNNKKGGNRSNVLQRCDLGSGCVIQKRGNCNDPCVENAVYECENQCRRYVECKNGLYHIQRCYYGHFDVSSKTCRRGPGTCVQHG